MKVLGDLHHLHDQKPEFIRQFYAVQKLMEQSVSETELTSKKEFDIARLDTALWRMLEKGNKKKFDFKKSK